MPESFCIINLFVKSVTDILRIQMLISFQYSLISDLFWQFYDPKLVKIGICFCFDKYGSFSGNKLKLLLPLRILEMLHHQLFDFRRGYRSQSWQKLLISEHFLTKFNPVDPCRFIQWHMICYKVCFYVVFVILAILAIFWHLYAFWAKNGLNISESIRVEIVYFWCKFV